MVLWKWKSTPGAIVLFIQIILPCDSLTRPLLLRVARPAASRDQESLAAVAPSPTTTSAHRSPAAGAHQRSARPVQRRADPARDSSASYLAPPTNASTSTPPRGSPSSTQGRRDLPPHRQHHYSPQVSARRGLHF